MLDTPLPELVSLLVDKEVKLDRARIARVDTS